MVRNWSRKLVTPEKFPQSISDVDLTYGSNALSSRERERERERERVRGSLWLFRSHDGLTHVFGKRRFYFETLHRANGSSKKRGLLFGGGGGKKHKPHLHAKYVLTILTEYLKVL